MKRVLKSIREVFSRIPIWGWLLIGVFVVSAVFSYCATVNMGEKIYQSKKNNAITTTASANANQSNVATSKKYEEQLSKDKQEAKMYFYVDAVQKAFKMVQEDTATVQQFFVHKDLHRYADASIRANRILESYRANQNYKAVTDKVIEKYLKADQECWDTFVKDEKMWRGDPRWQQLKRNHLAVLEEVKTLRIMYQNLPKKNR